MSRYPLQMKAGGVALVALLAAFSLSGCDGARRALGYDKSPPDEFAVVARAPLAQPPDFSLRPPTPGAPRPQEGTTRDQARTALLAGGTGGGMSARASASPGEQVLLAKAGADKAPADIRRMINEETQSLIEGDNSWTDKILFWRDKPQPGEPLDAAAEAKRLQENASLGKTAADGSGPQINRGKKGWLEGIF